MPKKLLQFREKELRDTPLTVRLPASVVQKLRKVAKASGVSQADVIERLIEAAFEEVTRAKK